MSDPAPSSALTPGLIERCAAAILRARRNTPSSETSELARAQMRRNDAIAVLTEALPAIRAQALQEMQARRPFTSPDTPCPVCRLHESAECEEPRGHEKFHGHDKPLDFAKLREAQP